MDNHGRTRAKHADATADGQRAAPQALRVNCLLVAVLTLAMGDNVLAKDATRSAAQPQANSSWFGFLDEAESVSDPSEPTPGIRQPKYALPVGGESSEPKKNNAPAEGDQNPQVKASSQAIAAEKPPTPAPVPPATTTATPVPTKQTLSGWTSWWRQVFDEDVTATAAAGSVQPIPVPAAVTDGKAVPPTVPQPGQVASQTTSSQFRTATIAPSSTTAENTSLAQAAAEVVPSEKAPSRFSKFAATVAGVEGRGKVVTALGKQLVLRSDELPKEESPNGMATGLRQQPVENKRTLDDSPLLQPFRATNPAAARPAGEPSYQSSPGSDRSPHANSLAAQLSMSTTDNWRSLSDSVADSPMLSDQPGSEQGWTLSVPSMTNPFTLVENPGWTAQVQTDGGTRLVAYQETLPTPPDQDGDESTPNNAAQNSDAGQGSGNEPKTLTDAKSLGEAPEDNTLQFLRTQTVLLEPGESQFDIGINYLFSENRFPILLLDHGNPVGADDVLFRIRELTFPLEYRFGVLKRVQAFVGAPIGWSNTQVAVNDYEQFQNDGGFGDIDFGTTIQLIDGNAESPHGLLTISATAPTGGDPFGAAAVLAQSAPSLGQGFWSISGNALCVQSYDPLVFFYGVGVEHFFAREFNDLEFEPGTSWNYSLGVGFAVNDRVTLSTRFLGSYIEEVRVDRQRVLGTNVEPMSIRMAATISKPCNRLVEPFVEFGITDSAVSSFFGITWTY